MSCCSLQVLSTDNALHSACLVLYTEASRILFDVGEGTQRLAVEHHVRMGKIRCICLTSSDIVSVGGLPGLLLTTEDAGCQKVDLLGPPSLTTFMDATRNFMRPIGVYRCPTVQHVHQNGSVHDELEPYQTKDIVIYPVPLACSQDTSLELVEHYCYLAQTPQLPGKFQLDRAIELGVPKGPLFGRLKSGNPVKLDDGRVVQPEEVLDKPIESQYFAIIPRLDIIKHGAEKWQALMSSLDSAYQFKR